MVSDDIVRQEIQHVDAARIVAHTRGLAEAITSGDTTSALTLASPLASGLGIENLILVDKQGREITHLILTPEGQVLEVEEAIGAGNAPIVRKILDSDDPESLPQRGIGINPADGRFYYLTAIPVHLEKKLAGVVIVGTSLDTLLPFLKSTSSADVIVYAENGEAIATSLRAGVVSPDILASYSITEAEFQQITNSSNLIPGENFVADGRWYSLAQGVLLVGNDRLGAFAVILPLNFVVQAGAVSRNTYLAIFTTGMLAVILIGYLITRRIVVPLSKLVIASKAIASGDLNRRTEVKSNDEIGELATSFDHMTQNLQQRTMELEKTNRALERIDNTKSRFIHISAHELRTPLTLVQGYAQIMEHKANADPELATLASGILQGTDRMTEVINNMLDVSRIDNKSLIVNPKNIKIKPLVTKAKKSFDTAIAERNLTFKVIELEKLPWLSANLSPMLN